MTTTTPSEPNTPTQPAPARMWLQSCRLRRQTLISNLAEETARHAAAIADLHAGAMSSAEANRDVVTGVIGNRDAVTILGFHAHLIRVEEQRHAAVVAEIEAAIESRVEEERHAAVFADIEAGIDKLPEGGEAA